MRSLTMNWFDLMKMTKNWTNLNLCVQKNWTKSYWILLG
jgi:hypothetical protein